MAASVPDRVVLDDLTQIAFASYTPCAWIYNAPEIKTSNDWEALSRSLRGSYFETFDLKFPLLSSKLIRDPEEGNRLVLVEPNTVANLIDFQEISDWCPSQESLDTGCLKGWPVNSKLTHGSTVLLEENHISLKVRLTWCHNDDGRSVVVLLGLFSHLLFDGTTRTMFMNEWSAIHRQKNNCEIPSLPVPAQPPVQDHSVLRGRSEPLITHKPDMFNTFISQATIIELGSETTQPLHCSLRILFPRSVLIQMQKENSSEEVQVTKNDVLFATLWKSIQTVSDTPLHPPNDTASHGFLAVSVRNRYPGFTIRHCGNAIVGAFVKVEDIEKTSIGEIAQITHQCVQRDAAETSIQHILDWAVQISPEERIPGSYLATPLGSSLMSTQWRNLPMYNVNFGPLLGGTPALVIPAVELPGLFVALPPRPSPDAVGQALDDQEGVIAQVTLIGTSEEEKEKFMKLMPSGARLLTEMEFDANL